MVCDNTLLLLAHNTVLLLFSGKYNLNSLKKIRLTYEFTSVLYRSKCCLINHIGKISSNCSGGCKRKLSKINSLIHLNILGMNLQSLNPSLKVRLFNDNTSVKTTRTKQSLIKDLRTVCRRKNNNTLRGIKTIHLGKQLIKCLLTLRIATTVFAVTASSDSIDLINKYNTRRNGCSLFEKISYTRRAHTDIKLHKIRTRKREERNIRLTGYRLGKQGLTCSRRTYKQRALWKLRADF